MNCGNITDIVTCHLGLYQNRVVKINKQQLEQFHIINIAYIVKKGEKHTYRCNFSYACHIIDVI